MFVRAGSAGGAAGQAGAAGGAEGAVGAAAAGGRGGGRGGEQRGPGEAPRDGEQTEAAAEAGGAGPQHPAATAGESLQISYSCQTHL